MKYNESFIDNFDYAYREKEGDDSNHNYEIEHLNLIDSIEASKMSIQEDYIIDYRGFDLKFCDKNMQEQVRTEIKRYDEIFARNDFDIGFLDPNKGQLYFEVIPGKRYYSSGYRMNPKEAGLLAIFEKKLMEVGVLDRAREDKGYRSPNFLVKKPGKENYNQISSFRMVAKGGRVPIMTAINRRGRVRKGPGTR